MSVKFGPSGNSQKFYEQGYKSSVDMPKWLNKLGLNAYEYQCNRGVKISKLHSIELKNEADKYGIQLSIHAPYYVNPAAQDDMRQKTIKYIMDTLYAASYMDAKRVVIHTGATKGKDRTISLNNAIGLFKEVIKQAKQNQLYGILMCPETMGKINQLGTLEEVLEICKLDDTLIPAIDFAHIHARGMGCLNSIDDFKAILDKIENVLGYERLKYMHVHFSRVEFTVGGEKKHWNMACTNFGPEFEPLAHLIYERGLEPTIICESRDTMDDDAVLMQNIYNEISNRRAVK